MDNQEEDFVNKLKGIFQDEAKEHLQALSLGLLELEKKLPEDKYAETIENIFREAHSLKGAARSVNLLQIQEICQSLENVFSAMKKHYYQPSAETFDTLHSTIDLIVKSLTTKLASDEISTHIQKLELIPSQFTVDLKQAPPVPPVEPSLEHKSSDSTVRVALNKLDHIFREVEETLLIKIYFKQQLSELKGVLSDLKSQEKVLEGFTSSNSSKFLDQHRKDLKSTREHLNKIVKNADQNTHFITSMVDSLLEDGKKILMQPVSTIFDTLPIMVRDIARNLSKEVHLKIEGSEIEVDRRVLEEIKDPLLHLIRNAIDHGIEMPADRTANKKPPFGTITIRALESEGNHVSLSISDDGGGINTGLLKKKSIEKGIISEKDAAELSQEALYKLAFHSDISTSPIITELSGRGIGLGIVSEKVDKLGGQIKIDSTMGQGTTFTLLLPLTLATFRGVHITVKDQDFLIPTNNVKRVIRVKRNQIKRAENKETIIIDNQSYSYLSLGDILGLSKKEVENPDHFLYVLFIKASEQTIAFGVDYVHRECEILVKNLGKQCKRIKNIMAVTILEKGNIIPVLNPKDLITSAIKGEFSSSSSSKGKSMEKKVILLVEDSITTRFLLKNILTSAAFEVVAAVDGVEALEILQTQTFDLMMTDIEMPRMNGLELTSKVRAMEKFKTLPIIMCTALGSREDRERGIELGANAYIDKNSFNQQSLINIVKKLI